MNDNLIARLKSQISRGEPILFIGAGFSVEAFDANGDNIPGSAQLSKELWESEFTPRKTVRFYV